MDYLKIKKSPNLNFESINERDLNLLTRFNYNIIDIFLEGLCNTNTWKFEAITGQ